MKTKKNLIDFQSGIAAAQAVKILSLFLFLFLLTKGNAQEILLNGVQTPTCVGSPPPSPACNLINLYEDDFPTFDITSLTATGGATPYAPWDVIGLPDGLNFDSSGPNNENLRIFGAPEELGSFVITVTLTDNSSNTDVKNFNLQVLSGRRPVSIVMVLDRSGSMAWEVGSNTSGTPSRWDDLVTGGGLFGTAFQANGTSGDQLGVVYFESEPPETEIASGANFPDGFYNQPFSGIDMELMGETPEGWTSMGEGLFLARGMLEDTSIVPPGNRKVILLFTDGEQNRGRLVQSDGRTITDGIDSDNINPTGEIEIYPVAIFGPGGYLSILQDIAEFNNDDNLALFINNDCDPADPDGCNPMLTFEDVGVSFMTVLTTILQHSSPQLIELRAGNLDREGRAEETFTVNDSISQLQFYTISRDTLNIGLEIEKDGISISSGAQSNGSGYSFYTFDFPEDLPIGSSGGEWRVQIFGTSNGSYKIGAVADDHNLNLNYDLDSMFKVGDPLTTTVSLDYRGTPISDAGTVLWTVLKAGEDIGDLLARTGSKVDISDDQDAGSVGLQKYFDLLENNPEFAEALQANEQVIPLTNNGDGTYSGNFTNTDVTGIYQSIYFIKGDHPNIGTYIRTNFRSTVFSFDTIDNEISVLSSQVIDGGITLNYRPAFDVGGKVVYIGPAFRNLIKVRGDGISVQEVVDNGDGSYAIRLSGNPDAEIAISILDEEVYAGKASDFGKGGGILDDFEDWLQNTFGISLWVFLIILLLILVIIWIIKKVIK
ncbi:VWA domain-containing protein [Maribacter sp. 2307UL18-2]|uniref:VWA domain-containing protein n=1 Tax=Maribacter sp. 2307UL18-2 TaxID=3386274 RepID=UPI0039BD1A3A